MNLVDEDDVVVVVGGFDGRVVRDMGAYEVVRLEGAFVVYVDLVVEYLLLNAKTKGDTTRVVVITGGV